MLKLSFAVDEAPATGEQIEAVQARLGFQLPRQYLEQLQEHNGGVPGPNRCTLKSAQDLVAVQTFLGICRTDDLDLERTFQAYRGRIGAALLPVARSEGGNLICISHDPCTNGKVYFWDHELESSDGETPNPKALLLIASSYRRFLSSLVSETNVEQDFPAGARVVSYNAEFVRMIHEQQRRK